RCAAVAPRLHTTTDWTLPTTAPNAGPGPLIDSARLGVAVDAVTDRPAALPIVHACALIDRSSALAVGGYDMAYAGSHFREESDFYARMWQHGRSVWLVPDTWAVHVRHRLGGGCRGPRGLVETLANRWSYWRNDARYIDRHARMWQHWGRTQASGISKLSSADRLLSNLSRQAMQRLGRAST
ncbi:MAG: hypothetical protein AAB263_04040, partial [Planctomycetota bacterium]